jgi:phosphopantothenoylcysteine decarboxylase / phosphopantothenate---cysteine ligase
MQGKRILLGVSGGIAAYKIASLVRLLIKSGAEVKCILTPASCDFISPLTVATLSKNPVGIEFWDKSDGSWSNHVEYGIWADVFMIAPLTANTLSKLANGGCDNLLLATYLSMKCPVIAAPAMDLDMYVHPSTVRNLEIIKRDGVQVVPAESGELASGLVGQGRMAEPEVLFDVLSAFFSDAANLEGKRVLITAGPTYESIDPVRFIGNHSSGKMGFALAKTIVQQGGKVTLVTGPTKLELKHPNADIIHVQSAESMLLAVQKEWAAADVGIFSAAVADYRPLHPAEQKIKKKSEKLTIELVKNPDILGWAGAHKKREQVLIGFALETNDARSHAEQKLQRKNLDFIVLNTLEDKGAGFGHDTNKISILDNDNNFTSFELMTKEEVSKDIVAYLRKYLN